MYPEMRITKALAEIEDICRAIPGSSYDLKVHIPGSKWEHRWPCKDD